MDYERFSVYKNGYVTEDGKILEPLHVAEGRTERSSIRKSGVTKLNKEDYFIVKEEYDGKDWISMEGTEKPL